MYVFNIVNNWSVHSIADYMSVILALSSFHLAGCTNETVHPVKNTNGKYFSTW